MGKYTFLHGSIGVILSLGACNLNRAYGVQIPSPLQEEASNTPPEAIIPVDQAANRAGVSPNAFQPALSLTPQGGAPFLKPPPEAEPLSPRFSQKVRLGASVEFLPTANQVTKLAQARTSQPRPIPPPALPQEQLPPSLEPIPEIEPVLPPPSDLLAPPAAPTAPEDPIAPDESRLCVRQFIVRGSTVFSSEALSEAAEAAVFSPDTPRCNTAAASEEKAEGYELTFPQLLQARSAITEFYVERQYVTSGAFIPEQTMQAGIVEIQVVEGRLEDIQVTGNHRLNPNYVKRRLAIAGSSPLNIEQLLEGLQLLQLNPLIETIDAELSAGITPGSNLLEVKIVEADAFQTQFTLDNGRSPNVGSFRQQVEISHANLLGQGDGLRVGFANTNGSENLNLGYTWPINPRNGTVSLNFGASWSRVIEDSFDILNIKSNSRFLELTVRQPLYQTPTEEFALSFTASRQESEATFNPLGTGETPFRSRGSDLDGETQISALRFAQDWVKRSDRQVIAARSQLSLGLDLLDATVNESSPDGRFVAWRGQAQWVRLLAPDTLFLLRGDVQLADRPLASLEQISFGGQRTVRGYPQDELLTDSGALMSAEVRIPIYRNAKLDGLLQIAPFVDIGVGWNESGEALDPNTLVGVGLGLEWRQGDNFSARLDWGVPLISVDTLGDSLQENGLYFSVIYTPF